MTNFFETEALNGTFESVGVTTLFGGQREVNYEDDTISSQAISRANVRLKLTFRGLALSPS